MSSFINTVIVYYQSKFNHELTVDEPIGFHPMRSISPALGYRSVTPPRATRSPVRAPLAPRKKQAVKKTIYIQSSTEFIPTEEQKKTWIFLDTDDIVAVSTPYEILNTWVDLSEAFSTDPYDANATYIIQVRAYTINHEKIRESVYNSLKRFSAVTNIKALRIYTRPERFHEKQRAIDSSVTITVPFDWVLLDVLGKNQISFDVRLLTLDVPQDITSRFFSAFRTICREEPVLNQMFDELLEIYKADAKDKMTKLFALRNTLE